MTDDLKAVGRHIAERLDYLFSRMVAISGLLDIKNPEIAEESALAQAAVDIHDLAVTEQEWARQTVPSITDAEAQMLLTGYRVKLLELEAGCIALANHHDADRLWVVVGEFLEQRGQIPR